MMRTEGKRTRPGDFFLLAVLMANLVGGVGLIGTLRADLFKELVAAESTLASSKISYLWGKVLRFTSAVEQGRRVGENATCNGDAGALTIASDLPIIESFQRIRPGTGESLPLFIGAPRGLPGRGCVLLLAVLVAGGTRQDPHYVMGVISLADVDGYLVLQGETDPVSGSPLRIPLWNPGSMLARPFWSGSLFHASPRELAHLPELTPCGALMLAERIQLEVSGPNIIQYMNYSIHRTVSTWKLYFDTGGLTEDQIVSHADEASYAAKKAGKNQVVGKASA